jgi:hypothetical protein
MKFKDGSHRLMDGAVLLNSTGNATIFEMVEYTSRFKGSKQNVGIIIDNLALFFLKVSIPLSASAGTKMCLSGDSDWVIGFAASTLSG